MTKSTQDEMSSAPILGLGSAPQSGKETSVDAEAAKLGDGDLTDSQLDAVAGGGLFDVLRDVGNAVTHVANETWRGAVTGFMSGYGTRK